MKPQIAFSLRPLQMLLVSSLFTLAFIGPLIAQGLDSSKAEKTKLASERYGKLPLRFEANQGQADPQVKYLARGAGYALSLTNTGAQFAFYDSAPDRHEANSIGSSPRTRLDTMRGPAARWATERHEISTLSMQLVGSQTDASVAGEAPMQGTVNYFAGDDPAQWRSAIPTYGKVRYGGVYPGVDLLYYGSGQQLEFDFVVAPHADPSQIRMRFNGAGRLSLDKRGDLVIRNAAGDIRFHKPAIYQQAGQERLPIAGGFRIRRNGTVSFQLGAYDRGKPLIVDPVLAYSTLVGSGILTAMAVDEAGEVAVTGLTGIPIFTTPGAFETKDPLTKDGWAIFVAKVNAEGTGLIFATYLMGTEAQNTNSWVYSLGVDGEGNVYVAGQTDESNFPATKGAFMAKKPEGNTAGFVSKLNADGTKLIYSTFLGGSKGIEPGQVGGIDTLDGMAVDPAGHAYVVGTTWSSNFPTTPGAFQRKIKPGNIRNSCTVSKLNLDGSGLEYATYLGGSFEETCKTIAVDSDGNATVGGFTQSEDYPVTAGSLPRKVTGNGGDGMVSKLNANGTKLLYSTFLGGGSGLDEVIQITDDPDGNVYVLGGTDSTDFPTTPGTLFAHSAGSIGSYLAKFSAADMKLLYATYLQDKGYVSGYGVAADSSGNAYVTGNTSWATFPVTRGALLTFPYAMEIGDNEAPFLMVLNETASALRYATFLAADGNPGCGCAKAVAVDKDADVYLAGGIIAIDFPFTHALMTKGPAPYVMKLNAEYMKALPPTAVTVTANVNPQKHGGAVTFTAQVKSVGNGGGVPTGLVGLDFDGFKWKSVMLDSKGMATFTMTTTFAMRGVQHMVVMYLGDDNHAPSNNYMAEVIE
jgi:hypothetical protein